MGLPAYGGARSIEQRASDMFGGETGGEELRLSLLVWCSCAWDEAVRSCREVVECSGEYRG